MDLLPILSRQDACTLEAKILPTTESVWNAMNSAARGIAAHCEHLLKEIATYPTARPLNVLFLAGTGHNAGDGLLALDYLARSLKSPLSVSVCFIYGTASLKPATQKAWAQLQENKVLTLNQVSVAQLTTLSETIALCLDGIGGFNVEPPLREPAQEALKWINNYQHCLLRVAIDVPSGLPEIPPQIDAAPLYPADAVFRADATIATGVVKLAVSHPEHLPWVGRIRLADLGWAKSAGTPGNQFLLSPSSLNRFKHHRSSIGNKRHYGHVFVLAGSRFMMGAALMTIQAAIRAGAGLVTGLVPAPLAPRLAASAPEAMWLPLPVAPDGTLTLDTLTILRQQMGRATALVMGPGMDMDKSTRNLMTRITREISLPLVLDASALIPEVMAAIVGRPEDAGHVILTPHWGEFHRIARDDLDTIILDDELSAYARKVNSVIALKGVNTRVSNGERLTQIPTGGPVLSRGGTGDILAGITGALLAQSPEKPYSAACEAALWHGAASDLLAAEKGQHAVATTELLNYLSPALRQDY